MAAAFQFKRGDTFLQQMVLQDEVLPATNPKTYVAVDMTGWSVKSQVRNSKNDFLADLAVTYTDRANGAYELKSGDTTGWPENKTLFWDIQYTEPSGQIVSTATIEFDCLRDITLPTSA